MSNFEVKCCYCGGVFDLTDDGNEYPAELFDDGGDIERTCPDLDCGKNLHIKVEARWEYSADECESDDLNGD